jgi:diguanylate cyclase (GGDEF)-like protein
LIRFFRGISIKRKLNGIIMLTSTLALLLASAGLLTNHALSLRRTMEAELDTLAQVIATHSTAALTFNDPQAATETLGALKAHPDILFGCIYRRNGTMFAQYLGSQAGHGDFPSSITPGLLQQGSAFTDTHLDIVKTITLDGEPLGTLVIRVSLAELLARLARYTAIGAVIILLASLLAYLLASLLQKVVSRPIEELAEAMAAVTREKDYARRVEPRGNDELGQLIGGFNEMLGQIELRDEKLERHRRHLEETVEQRTRELRASMDEAYALAFYDNLTGLANRLQLKDRLEAAINTANRHQEHAALLFLDLDRFKRINDTLGHHIGDLLLKKTAERLSRCVRSGESFCYLSLEDLAVCVSRLGGDEFCIMLSDLAQPEDAAKAARRIIEAVSEPHNLEGYEVIVTTSIGISIFPEDGTTPETLLKKADTAMYHAKEQGRNNYQFFEESMHAAALQRLTLESDLRKGLERGEFVLYYQPQIELPGREIVGAEALLRWHHPQRGVVLPGEFIPVAEESGLIIPLSEWLLRAACEQILAWLETGLRPGRISVNISGHHFSKPDFFDTVKRILRETGLDPGYLEFELTESSLMESSQAAKAVLQQLKQMGCCIAIDDFGTGYSSLNYLKAFPIDTLKIDRSFVSDLASDPNDAAIIRAIVALARNLELNVVAEGVETEEQLGFLSALGCRKVQGFLFSPALESERFAALLGSDPSPFLVPAAPRRHGSFSR